MDHLNTRMEKAKGAGKTRKKRSKMKMMKSSLAFLTLSGAVGSSASI